MSLSALHSPRRPHSILGTPVERFAAAVARAGGIHLSDLAPLDQLSVRTCNSTYEITILGPHEARVLVQGGAFFPIAREAHLSGSSLGGSLLKLQWIGCGFSLEIVHEHCRIVTTRVQSIAIDRQGRRAD
ncbi:MAG TPA: hypothetical protein VD833_11550 [Vicinamibacterales bacterium]|nr:hypothetical protein [Vicinamibacterales bacterium]